MRFRDPAYNIHYVKGQNPDEGGTIGTSPLPLKSCLFSPIDAAQLREQFAFPASIRVYDGGLIKDSPNRVDIRQAFSHRLFSFE